MKVTLELDDALLTRARRSGRPLRALVEEGLRLALEGAEAPTFRLQDLSVGDPKGPNPLAGMSWADLREAMYGGR